MFDVSSNFSHRICTLTGFASFSYTFPFSFQKEKKVYKCQWFYFSVFHFTSCTYVQPKEKAAPMCDIIPGATTNWYTK